MKSSGAGVGVLTGEQEIVRYLLEDVALLPIITNRAQELWLGVPLSAFKRLKERRADRPAGNWLPEIVAAFGRSCGALADMATETHWTAEMSLSDWARELLVARANIYGLQRSQLRRLLDHLEKEATQPAVRLLVPLYEVVELLTLLPNELLKLLAQTPSLADVDPTELLALRPPELGDRAYVSWAREMAHNARQHLVTGYLRYALRVARNYAGDGMEYSDLAQNAFLGLMRAAERFDYRVNARFGTYATSCIWQSVTRGLADEQSLIRFPVHIREKLDKLSRMVEARDNGLTDPLSDPIFLRETGFLAEATEETTEEEPSPDGASEVQPGSAFSRAERRVRRLLFLSEPVALSMNENHAERGKSDGSSTLEDCLVGPPPRDLSSYRQTIDSLLTHLNPREREVLEWRFGLNNGQEHTLEEIGQIYDLTRERIRQIEAKAKKRLEQRLAHREPPLSKTDLLVSPAVWNIALPQIAQAQPIDLIWRRLSREGVNYAWLDQLLSGLPQSNWHAPRPGGARYAGTRAEQLAEALLNLGAPAHYTRLIEAVNELLPARHALEEATGYNILVTNERTFLLLGEGIFSLIEWEKERARAPQPQLPYCPLALPDPPDFEDALFESIFVGHEYLAQQPAAADFLAYMLRWAGVDPTTKPWLRQGILSAYYLLGLIPYTFLYGGDNPRLRSTLPDGDVQTLRRYGLEALTARLVAMPEFWWVLRCAGPARPVDVGEQLAELHPHGLDDARQRLYLLHSLGAVVRLPNGAYRLTPLGEACVAEWGRSPDDEADAILEIEAGYDADLLAWGFLSAA